VTPELRQWIERARDRRREDLAREPFARGIVPDDSLDPIPGWEAAAAALLSLIGERDALVTFTPGTSYVKLPSGVANLDGSVFDAPGPIWDAAERLLAIAAHEGGHRATTAAPPKESTRLFLWLYNLIEDERVECEVAHRFPRLAHPLRIGRHDLIGGQQEGTGFFEVLFMLVRTPERFSPAQWKAHEMTLLGVMKILDPFPATASQTLRAVSRIIQFIPAEVRGLTPPRFPELLATRREEKEGPTPRTRRVDSASGTVVWKNGAEDAHGYARVHRSVAPHAAALRKRLYAMIPPCTRKTLRRGSLDRRRLYAWQMDDRLFRGADVSRESLALALVIDLSDAMNGFSAELAQRLSVMLSEAALGLPGAQVYVYGHTAHADGVRPHTEITRFATPARGPALSLGCLPIGGAACSPKAFRVIGNDLRRIHPSRRSRNFAFLISDWLSESTDDKRAAWIKTMKRTLLWFEQTWGRAIPIATSCDQRIFPLMEEPIIIFDPRNPTPGFLKVINYYIGQRLLPRS
jgi:hypothetical protein